MAIFLSSTLQTKKIIFFHQIFLASSFSSADVIHFNNFDEKLFKKLHLGQLEKKLLIANLKGMICLGCIKKVDYLF